MRLIILLSLFYSCLSFAAIKKETKSEISWTVLQQSIVTALKKPLMDKIKIMKLKSKVIDMNKEAVPVLVEVMKNDKYPEKNRWIATMLLGRVMGAKAAPFISKFSKHPSWVLRMASLKALLALSQKKYAPIYAKLLSDKSLIVRTQALENIKKLNLSDYAPYVWKMLYDKNNYTQNEKGFNKRTHIIKRVISTVGLLNFKEAKAPMLKMIQNKRYKDIFAELDQALSMITGKKSPKGKMETKKVFWKRFAMGDIII
jgi:HEAT repeat protein